MDKRVLIAAGLSVLILVLWNQIFPPPKPPPTAKNLSPIVDSLRPVADENGASRWAPAAEQPLMPPGESFNPFIEIS